MWIIVYGNPIDGFGFEGPFSSPAEAERYAEPNHDVYWIARVGSNRSK